MIHFHIVHENWTCERTFYSYIVAWSEKNFLSNFKSKPLLKPDKLAKNAKKIIIIGELPFMWHGNLPPSGGRCQKY